MKNTRSLFDASGWMISPTLVSDRLVSSAIIPDLPTDSVVDRLEEVLTGEHCRIAWRNVDLNEPETYQEIEALFARGLVDKFLSVHIVSPLIVFAPRSSIVFFKDSANEFYVVAGPKSMVEYILGCSMEEARDELKDFVTQLPAEGRSIFSELESIYFKR